MLLNPSTRAIGALFGSLALLSACGGGSDAVAPVDATPKTLSQAVTVVDGPLKGAVVCLDRNANGACDADETQGVTAADGSLTLTVPVADAGKYAVLALVGTDAVDAVNGAVATAYVMKAPADNPGVVSPLTTLVTAQVDASGSSSADAEKTLQDRLGTSASLFDNYAAKTDASAVQAATLARLWVLTVQQQMTDTVGAKAADGSALSKADLVAAINQSLLAVLPTVAASAADPAVANAASAAEKEVAIKAAALKVAAEAGLTGGNVATVVATAKLAGTPEGTAAPAAGSTVRWFTFTDAGNYFLRSFKSTAAQNTVVNGKRQYTEYREQTQTSGGSVTQYLQWGAGLNNWQRNQIVWTGSEWFDCPNDLAHEGTAWDASGKSDSLYCKAYKTINRRSARDVSGLKMVDVVKDIRAFPLYDSAGKFSAWGPDPVANASALAATFPAGSTLFYYTGIEVANPDLYGTTAGDWYVPYNAAIAAGTASECAKVTASNGAQFQARATTLEQMAAAAPGVPCVYTVSANMGETVNEWWSSSTISIGDVADPYVSSTGYHRSGVKNLRVSFAAANVANYWLCLRRASDGSARNCKVAGSGSYSVETLGDARVMRFAGQPLIAGNLTYNRIMVERGGKVWYGSRSKLQATHQLRLNQPASDALFTALGMPAPQAAAPLTADSLLARYVTGAGTLSRNALAFMANDAAGLAGAWGLVSASDAFTPSFFFFADGRYVMVDPLGDTAPNPCGGAGVELGRYAFDKASGAFAASGVTKDTNGCAGLHDTTNASNPNGSGKLSFNADGKTATFTSSDGDSSVLQRLTQ